VYGLTLLLEKGADIEAKDHIGRTPLHMTTGEYTHHHLAAMLLVEKGADMNAKRFDGRLAIPEGYMREAAIRQKSGTNEYRSPYA
jgi:Ankyrin repeat